MRPTIVALLTPLLGRLARVVVPTYAVMLALGCLAGAVVLVEGARRAGYPRRDSLAVIMAAYVSGLAGAWVVPIAQACGGLVAGEGFAMKSGMAAYGGLMGGVAGGLVVLRAKGLRVLPFLDEAAPGMGLGYFLARIGCFLAGCDYGVPTSRAFGVVFPPGSHAFRDHVARGLVGPGAEGSLPVHPTQLYSSFVGLSLYFAVSAMPRRGRGDRFLAYVIGYAAARSLVELWRGDAGRGFVGPLSTSQMLSALSVACAAALVLTARRREVVSSGLEPEVEAERASER